MKGHLELDLGVRLYRSGLQENREGVLVPRGVPQKGAGHVAYVQQLDPLALGEPTITFPKLTTSSMSLSSISMARPCDAQELLGFALLDLIRMFSVKGCRRSLGLNQISIGRTVWASA